MLVLDRDYVVNHLPCRDCVALMEDVLRREAAGEITQYLRTAIRLPNDAILGLMPGYDAGGYFGVKVLSVYHHNALDGYPSHQGQILLFEKDHGAVLAAIDAMSVTQIRTGAVSAAASRALARPDSAHLCVLGCGAQGQSHLQAMAASFDLKRFTCWDVRPESARVLAEMGRALGIASEACPDARTAVTGADIVCTVTPSKTPILEYGWLKPGAHVNAVGACAPADRELDSETVARARFFGDNYDSVMHESGDFLIPLAEGRFEKSHFLGTVGDVLLGKLPGRTSDDQLTVFEALGMAVEDLACAVRLYEDYGRTH